VATRARYLEHPTAFRTVEKVASPQLDVTSRAIAVAIPSEIPVHHGVAKRITSVSVEKVQEAGARHPVAHVLVRSPWWHFLEYGTRFGPPYRPIQRGAEKIVRRFEAH
jgi:hypothetical protein